MDGHYMLKTLRPDLNEAQRSAIIAALVQAGIPEDRQFHDELGREAEKLFPFGTGVRFASKFPYHKWWLEVSYPDDKVPVVLLRDLAAIGWTWDAGMRKPDNYDPLAPVPRAPAFGGRVEIDVTAKGTEVFGDWTKAEQQRYQRGIRKVLAMHGFVKVPHRKLTLADLL